MTVPVGLDRTCVNCGQPVAKEAQTRCNHCGVGLAWAVERWLGVPQRVGGRPFAPQVVTYEGLVAGDPPAIVRTYGGKQLSDAAAAFHHDAVELAKFGYTPSTQSWAQGQWGAGAFVVALLLCIILIGILVFIYMLIVKPAGTLTVTYAKAATPETHAASPQPQGSPPPSLSARLAQLDEARSGGLITPEEYEAKRSEVLKNL
jgi:hypothetical protein